MKKIHALDRHTVNKIAAGEVVDRPRSVIKELVENALDAGGDRITVSVSSSPVDLMEVADNGSGIPYDEIPLAFRRHATSKIAGIHDLEHLSSLGFRGEALPSIASVSRCSLVTKTDEEEHGGRIEIVGGKQTLLQAAGRDRGTTVRVENLFFNVPARRKFLKTPSYEFRLIREFIATTALLTASLGTELLLRREGETILQVGREETLFQRIEALFGEGVSRALIPVERQSGSMSVKGFVSGGDAVNRHSGHMYLFINGRPVKDKGFIFAVRNAMQELLLPGNYPFAFLFASLPPESLDVNVHPQKSEVRFLEERRFYGNLHKAVSEAFARIESLPGASFATRAELEKACEERGGAAGGHGDIPEPGAGPSLFDAARPFYAVEGPVGEKKGNRVGDFEFSEILFHRYLLFTGPSSLLLVDFHALNERLVYDRLMKQADESGRAKIIPEAVSLGRVYTSLVKEHKEEFHSLGFELRPFGDDTVVVEEVPAALSGLNDLEKLLRDLCHLLEEGGDALLFRERMARQACKASLRTGDRITEEDIAAFARSLETGGFTMTCPHGRPVARIIDGTEIDRLFKR